MSDFRVSLKSVRETLPPHYYTLSYSHHVPTHNTKPEALLFIVRIGRSTLSWMGWIRYVLLLDERRSTQEPRCCFMTQISSHKQRRRSKVNTELKTAVQVRNSTKRHLEQLTE